MLVFNFLENENHFSINAVLRTVLQSQICQKNNIERPIKGIELIVKQLRYCGKKSSYDAVSSRSALIGSIEAQVQAQAVFDCIAPNDL
jgi:hypothetical protein